MIEDYIGIVLILIGVFAFIYDLKRKGKRLSGMTREEAKNILTCVLHTNGAFMDYLDREDVEAIKFLANDERPHGKWGIYGATCSNCGTESDYRTPFCAFCGADMREEEGEGDS